MNRLITEIGYKGEPDFISVNTFIWNKYRIHIYVYLLPRGFRSAIQYKIDYTVQTVSGNKADTINECYADGINNALNLIKKTNYDATN